MNTEKKGLLKEVEEFACYIRSIDGFATPIDELWSAASADRCALILCEIGMAYEALSQSGKFLNTHGRCPYNFLLASATQCILSMIDKLNEDTIEERNLELIELYKSMLDSHPQICSCADETNKECKDCEGCNG